ncbi:MAG TPA: POTRA domain-containing protein [Chitinophagaceae bacterium]
MLSKIKYCLWLLLAMACCHAVHAQVPVNGDTLLPGISPVSPAAIDSSKLPVTRSGETSFKVRNIEIKGNKRTRADIILREIPFKPGDSFLLQVLVEKFETGRRQLMNTSLFHTVIVSLKTFDGYEIDVLVQVRERWYIFPVPYFKPVDRNLNQWLVEQKADLSRANYGIKVLYNNATGRNDKLRFWLMSGYTKQFSISYDRLYIDKKMKWGMNAGFATGKNKEMNYSTIDNKQEFLKDETFVRNFLNASIEATYRRAIKTRHRFGIAYIREEISDTIHTLNPGYFPESRKRVAFPDIYYSMAYYDLDYIPYPSKGYAGEVYVSKKGISSAINVWQLSARGLGSWPTGKSSFFSLSANGLLKLPFKQPYYTKRALGYGSMYMQGYEYYVVDGVASAVLKATYTRKLFTVSIKGPGGKKKDPLRIPFTFYAKAYGNTGIAYDPEPGENFLTNKMLYSGGFGIDIFTLYDVVLKFELSFNQLGQNGLFIHRNIIF